MEVNKKRSVMKIMKIVVTILIIIIVLIGIVATVLFGMSKSAVNDYRAQAAKQLNAVINGEKVGLPVELQQVWLANLVNPRYKRATELQSEYKELFNAARNYTAVVSIHNAIVGLHNDGADDMKTLNGDILISAKKYLSTVESYFPEETERIEKLRQLVEKIVTSTTFSDINADLSAVLNENEQWIAELGEQLNSRIDEFQKKLQM